jgi:hypothetical protein
VVVTTPEAGFDMLPANGDLVAAEIELLEIDRRERRLKELLSNVGERYDFIVIDCPPSLSLLTVNAMVAAHSVLIPLQSEFFALEGLSQLLLTIREVRQSANPDLRIEGVLLTMYDARNNLSQQVESDARDNLGDLVCKTVIPRNVRVSEAPSYAQPVLDYDPANIREVKLNYPRQPEESFRILRDGEDQYRVEPLIDRPLVTRQLLNERVKAYFQEFRRKGLLSYVNDRPQIDTVLEMTPFAELEVISNDADTQRIVFIPQSSQNIQGPNSQSPYQFFEFRYYVFLPATMDIALAQHMLWRPIFRGYEHFFAG